jgi:hypothetical protein
MLDESSSAAVLEGPVRKDRENEAKKEGQVLLKIGLSVPISGSKKR